MAQMQSQNLKQTAHTINVELSSRAPNRVDDIKNTFDQLLDNGRGNNSFNKATYLRHNENLKDVLEMVRETLYDSPYSKHYNTMLDSALAESLKTKISELLNAPVNPGNNASDKFDQAAKLLRNIKVESFLGEALKGIKENVEPNTYNALIDTFLNTGSNPIEYALAAGSLRPNTIIINGSTNIADIADEDIVEFVKKNASLGTTEGLNKAISPLANLWMADPTDEKLHNVFAILRKSDLDVKNYSQLVDNLNSSINIARQIKGNSTVAKERNYAINVQSPEKLEKVGIKFSVERSLGTDMLKVEFADGVKVINRGTTLTTPLFRGLYSIQSVAIVETENGIELHTRLAPPVTNFTETNTEVYSIVAPSGISSGATLPPAR